MRSFDVIWFVLYKFSQLLLLRLKNNNYQIYNYYRSVDRIYLDLSISAWPDFPASDFKFILAFEEIGFVWVCFFGPEGSIIFIILYNIYVYVHFGPLTKLGLFIRTTKSSFFL